MWTTHRPEQGGWREEAWNTRRLNPGKCQAFSWVRMRMQDTNLFIHRRQNSRTRPVLPDNDTNYRLRSNYKHGRPNWRRWCGQVPLKDYWVMDFSPVPEVHVVVGINGSSPFTAFFISTLVFLYMSCQACPIKWLAVSGEQSFCDF